MTWRRRSPRVSPSSPAPSHDLVMHVSSTDGVTIVVHDLGGSGDLMLLCHATGFHARAYEPLAAQLASHFHVLALDFRGHGDSTAPHNGRFDWEGMADDLLAVVDALDCATDLRVRPFDGRWRVAARRATPARHPAIGVSLRTHRDPRARRRAA